MYPIHLAGPISGRRAYTDPISNAVANSSVDPLEVGQELAEGRLSPEFLNVVLHETTHYSSFLSPVGYALGALMAAHTANPVGFIDDQDRVEGPARIAIQAEVLATYFTPLLEGLALFSEFDAAPGASPVASTVSSVALRLFCKADLTASASLGRPIQPFEYLNQFICRSRTNSDAVARKLSLLGQPLESDSGYLIGYLWIKALWRVLIGPCRKLLDTDLFMSFIIDYFFGDFKLASLLFQWQDAMRSTDDLEGFVIAIEYYVFGHRLEQLVANVTKFVDEYEKYAVQHPPGHISTSQTDRYRPSYQNYSREAEAEVEMALAYGAIRSMHFMWPKFSVGRHLLRLFVSPADVQIAEDGTFTATSFGSTCVVKGAALENARPVSREKVSAQGSVEAIMLTQEMRIIICVFLGHELVATIDVISGAINDGKAAATCDAIASYLALEAASVQISEELHFRKGSKAEALYIRLMERARTKTYEYFSNLGLGRDNGLVQEPDVLKIFNAGGVVKLLEQSPGQAQWLARLSLSSGGRIATFEDAANQWQVRAEDICNWIKTINSTLVERCGKEAFALDDKSFGLCQY